jgi:methyl-accepting chemotaxis protein
MKSTTSSMTIGKKLGFGFGIMMAATFGMAIYAASELKYVGDEFDTVSQKDTAKLDLVGSIATAAAEMLSFERGIVNRVEMNDLPAAQRFHEGFAEQSRLVVKLAGDLRPLLATEIGKRDTESILNAANSWTAADEELWKVSRAKQLQVVRKILNTQSIPLATEMQRATGEIRQIERERIAQAARRGHEAIVLSRWIMGLLVALCAVIGCGVLVLVYRSTGELKRMAGELNESTSQIASASSQVASSSQSLAQGASQQAASLEETSASAEEITSMTRKNADNSRVAAEVMADVDRHVKDGNRTIEGMVLSMHEISESSGKISKIIKVIDEIAFQTNILALNAAVEAARAGEAGMGFAVVADEVRNLAQRSAQAAKDTAGLIEESISKSAQGGETLQQVTSVMGSITDSAAKVKMLVDEVNLGSQEQARGIEQISKAVSQMEQVTQGSAANAQESASASEELSAQAQSLTEIVNRLTALAGKNEEARDEQARDEKAKYETRRVRREGITTAKKSFGKPAPRTVAAKSGHQEFPLDEEFTEM